MRMDHSEARDIGERLAALEAVLPRKGRVLIFTHDYPDPDALAAAGALHLLLEKRFHLRSRIVFSGTAERAENRELLRHFRYKWSHADQLHVPKRTLRALFVDCQPWSGNISVPKFARPVAVFDHHPMLRDHSRPGLFIDLRPRMGACASVLQEYLAACDITPPPWLASCLVYAILAETIDFTRGFQPLDREAYLALSGRANLRMLGRIRNAPLPQLYFSLLQEAIANTRLYGRIAWSHLPEVPQPEIIADIADRLARLERISWSFCSGLHAGRLIVSLRSSRRDARCGKLLQRAFHGEGSAGGHDRMAAGSLDVSHLSGEERTKRVEEITLRLLKQLDRRHAQRTDTDEIQTRPLARVEEPTAPDAPAQPD